MAQATRGGWRRAWAAVTLMAAAACPRPAAGADPAQVDAAIRRGRAYLFAHQANGNWELVPTRGTDPAEGRASVKGAQWGGLTAIATVALLASGVDPADPRVKQAVDFLRTADVRGTYALSMRAQVWALLPQDPWVRQAEAGDLRLLEQGIHAGKPTGPGTGLYGYTLTSPLAEADHSASQFGVLGVWAMAQAGVEVSTAYWQLVDDTWHRQQLPSGGWSYYPVPDPDDPNSDGIHAPNLGMTSAGVATLFITQEYLQIAPRCNGNIDDPAIDAGLRFLGTHLDPLPGFGRYYALFGVSRVGLASGYKYLGTTDWFQYGSDALCREQDHTGGWTRAGGNDNANANGVPDTSFALLFLSRGRAPVMMNKLAYDVAGPGTAQAKPTPGTWDQRPRDVANLTRWVGRQIETGLNWQVVNLHQTTEDLHDAPILYLSGGRAPKLPPADADRLRTYLEDGGLVVGHADCSSSDFAKGFRALGESLFPGHKFRTLEPTSPIYTDETFPRTRWRTAKPVVDALSNGDRELMVLLPQGDPAKQWQGQSFLSVKTDVFGQLMIDLFLYSVDKEGLRKRGETYLVDRRASVPDAKPVKVARLRYAGGWDPEPGGWRRLANVLHNARLADLSTTPVDPAAGPVDRSFALASLTFVSPEAKLTDAARASIRDYVKGGGTLLVDAAGGNPAVASAAAAEIARVFPDAPTGLSVLPPDSPVYAAAGPAFTARSVEYRRYHRSGTSHAPRLRGYTVGGRLAVLFSAEDVSAGLVGQPIDGIVGYVPADATKVVADVVALAAKLPAVKVPDAKVPAATMPALK